MRALRLAWAVVLAGLAACATTPVNTDPVLEAAEQSPAASEDATDTEAGAESPESSDEPELPASGEIEFEAIPLPSGVSAPEIAVQPFTEEGESRPVALDFDNADISEVIKVFASLLDMDYVLDEGIKGNVSIKADLVLNQRDLWDLFRRLLEFNGLGVVQKGELYVIGDASAQSRQARMGASLDRRIIKPGEGMVIQIVPVQYMPAAEMSSLLKSFAGAASSIQVYERANLLIIVDTPESLRRLLEIKNSFDSPNMRGIQARLYTIKEVAADRMVQELEPILTSLGIGGLSDSPSGVKLMPIPRLNKLIALTGAEKNFEVVQYWIRKLDHVEQRDGAETFIYRVKNGKAEDIAELLTALFSKMEAESEGGAAAAPSSRPAGDVIKSGTALEGGGPASHMIESGRGSGPASVGKPEIRSRTGGLAAGLEGEFRIIADIYSNSLIIQASREDYQAVRQVLEEIDVLPRQVLVEVIVADVTLTDSADFGLSWAFNQTLGGSGGSGSTLEDGVPSFLFNGAQLTTAYMDKSLDFVSALSLAAGKGDVRILSSPTLWATDNVGASINIGQQIPISTTSVQTDTNLTGTTTFNRSFQYQRVGMILDLTPRITDSGIITLDLALTISEAGAGSEATLPLIRERSTSTTLWARDGQTLITGGLIEETESENDQGIPFLMDIPILGYLFKTTGVKKSRTELLLMFTPHIIRDLDEADRVVEEFTRSVNRLKTDMDSRSGWAGRALETQP